MQLQFSINKPSSKSMANAGASLNAGGNVIIQNGGGAGVGVGEGGAKSLRAWEVAMRVYREQGVLAFWRGKRLIF